VKGSAAVTIALAAVLVLPAACERPPLVLTPAGPPTATCPVGGCHTGDGAPLPQGGIGPDCVSRGDSPCGGASATECTERALAAWSEATDDRAVACVARIFAEACSLDDARACGFAGRLWLDGRGVSRDTKRGLELLMGACDDGVATACAVGIRWANEPANAGEMKSAPDLLARLEAERTCLAGQGDACLQVGLLFFSGRDAYPRDRTRAMKAFERGCDLGDSRACRHLGRSLFLAEGVAQDVERAATVLARACHSGDGPGCSTLGSLTERGQGVARDVAKARALYHDGCTAGDVSGCLHAEMLLAQPAVGPHDPEHTLARWSSACDGGHDARACAFVAILYQDGAGRIRRDDALSEKAMTRACELGEGRACEWVQSHPGD
jgi:TPR repeat protein